MMMFAALQVKELACVSVPNPDFPVPAFNCHGMKTCSPLFLGKWARCLLNRKPTN